MGIIRQYLLFALLVSSIFNQELENGEIIVSKNDLLSIADALIESEDYTNAVAIYQQILDYQISTHGIISNQVANTSLRIGELMLESSNFEDAEIYITQSLRLRSQILLQNQISLQPSMQYLREIYIINNDSIKLDEINNQLSLLSNADSMSSDNDYWDPITFGLNDIFKEQNDILESYNYSNYQSINLVNIADSYFEAGLYYDGIENILRAIKIDPENISIEFLHNYVNRHISIISPIMNALINYSSDDSLYTGENKFFLSLIHFHRSEDELANYYIEDYIQTNPIDYRSLQLVGDYHFNKNNYLSALFSYRKSQLINRNNLYTLFKSAVCLHNLNYMEESIDILSQILKNNSDNQDGYYLRALSYMNINQYRNAIKDFTNYILLNPDDEEIYFHLGACYYNIKKYNRSKEALTRYLKFNNENGDAHYYLGMINENILELDAAVTHYTLARKFNPKLMDSNLKLGLLHYKNKNYKSAVEPLRDYLIFNPDSIHVLETFAEILVHEQRYSESIDAYYKLYEFNPMDNKYLHIIADSYIKLGRSGDAKDLLTKLIILGEINSDVLSKLATIEVELGEYDDAINHYLMAIEIGEPSLELYYNLAMSYAQIENYMQALLAFQNAYKFNSDDNDLIFQISMCYKELEIYNEAIKYLNLFINNSEEDYIAYYLMGELYFLIEDYNNSEFYLNKSLTLNPRDHLCLYYLGMCYFAKNNYITSAKYFKKSIKLEPDHAGTHFNLALVYHALGKTREVKKELNIIYMLDQDLHNELSAIVEKK